MINVFNAYWRTHTILFYRFIASIMWCHSSWKYVMCPLLHIFFFLSFSLDWFLRRKFIEFDGEELRAVFFSFYHVKNIAAILFLKKVQNFPHFMKKIQLISLTFFSHQFHMRMQIIINLQNTQFHLQFQSHTKTFY